MTMCVCLFLLLEHSSEWRLHQSVVCHEDIPHTQHPHHHDLVLETDHPHEQTTCAAGEVSSYFNAVTILSALKLQLQKKSVTCFKS